MPAFTISFNIPTPTLLLGIFFMLNPSVFVNLLRNVIPDPVSASARHLGRRIRGIVGGTYYGAGEYCLVPA